MAVTMQQVAELAGVSRGTVDRVLHGRPNVNAVVREKVLRAAEKLGYRCKKAASAPRHRAAILIPQWTDTYFNRQVISGIRRALRYIADDSFELLEVPLRTMRAALAVFPIVRAMAEEGNPNSVSDAGVGALAARSAAFGARLNVRINAAGLKDRAKADALVSEADALAAEAARLEAEVLEIVGQKIG